MPFYWAQRVPCTQVVPSECLLTGHGAELCPRGMKAEPAACPSKMLCPRGGHHKTARAKPRGKQPAAGGEGQGQEAGSLTWPCKATDALHLAPCRRPSGVAFPSSSSALFLGTFTRGAPCQPRGDSKRSLPAGLTVSSPRLCPACLPAPRPLRVRCLKMNSGSPTPTAPASLPGATIHSAAQAETWCCAFSCLPVALCVAGSGRPRWLSAPQYLHSASSCPSAPSGREPWTAAPPLPHRDACVREQLGSP